MKKSIKKFLIISQVLGWSALAASACTDDQVKNTSQNSNKETQSSDTKDQTNKKPDQTDPTTKHNDEGGANINTADKKETNRDPKAGNSQQQSKSEMEATDKPNKLDNSEGKGAVGEKDQSSSSTQQTAEEQKAQDKKSPPPAPMNESSTDGNHGSAGSQTQPQQPAASAESPKAAVNK